MLKSKRINNIKTLFWTLKFLYKIDGKWLVGILIFKTLPLILSTSSLYATSRIIDSLIYLKNNSTNALEFDLHNPLIINIIIKCILLILFHVSSHFSWILMQKKIYMRTKISHELHNLYTKIPSEFIEDEKVLKQLHLANENLGYLMSIMDLIIQYLSSFIPIGIGAYFSFKIRLYPLIIFVLIFLLIVKLDKKYIKELDDLLKRTVNKIRAANMLKSKFRYPDFMRFNTVYNVTKFIKERSFKVIENIRLESYKIAVKRHLIGEAYALGIGISYGYSTFILAKKVLLKDLSIGNFTFYVRLVYTMLNGIWGFTNSIRTINVYLTNINYIKQAFDTVESLQAKRHFKGKIKLKHDEIPSIELRNVWFKYPGHNKWVLRGINLTINPKDIIAFVGSNGAGKTTLLKLILGIYLPTKGHLLINGIDIKKIDINSYRQKIGIAFQNYTLFSTLSLKDNVWVSKSQEPFNEKDFWKSINIVDLEHTIKNFKNGIETKLNPTFKDGTDLSGGQTQRLALARVFYKDPQILILDEPTSAIDALAEYKIFNRLFDSNAKRTIIIVSHRFSTIKKAKMIYVIKDGKIVESGTHRKLLNLNGLYADSYKKQKD